MKPFFNPKFHAENFFIKLFFQENCFSQETEKNHIWGGEVGQPKKHKFPPLVFLV